jgi:transcriptional regulator with XRE-family HTH domain
MEGDMETAPSGAPPGEWQRLGQRLKEVREYLNLSQQYVADRTGIPRSAVSDVERAVRKVDSLELKKLAGLYRRPVGFFLDEDADASPDDHAIAALARLMTALEEPDRLAVRQFAEFLRQNKARSEPEP